MNKIRKALSQSKVRIPILLFILAVLTGHMIAELALRNQAANGPDSKTVFVSPAQKPNSVLSYVAGKLERKTRRVIVLDAEHSVGLRGPVDGDSVSRAEVQLSKLSLALPKDAIIYLVMDTPGGSVEDGVRLIDFVQALPQKVQTITVFSASMGFQIVQNLDHRMILPSGTLMSHRARGRLDGQMPGELVTRLNFFLKEFDRHDAFTAARMGLSSEKYRELIRDEYWTSGESAVEEHAADEVVLARCDKSLNTKEKITMTTLFGDVNLTYSSCPLIGEPLEIKFGGASKEDNDRLRTFTEMMIHDRKKFVTNYIVPNRLGEIVRTSK